MKKRKPPVVLATCLVLMLVGVAVVYAPNRGGADDGHDHGMAEPPPPSVEQGERPKMTPQQVSALSSKAATPQPAATPGPRLAPGEKATPSVSIPKAAPYKPTPNDSSTSTQWYVDETKK